MIQAFMEWLKIKKNKILYALIACLRYVQKKLSTKSTQILKTNVLHHLLKGTAWVKAKLHNKTKNINIKFNVFRFLSLVRQVYTKM